MEKACRQCRENKLLSEFNRCGRTAGGYNSKCKTCVAELRRLYRKRTAEHSAPHKPKLKARISNADRMSRLKEIMHGADKTSGGE